MSENKSENAAGGGISFGGALFIAFLVLKLTGYIDWSWWWVTAPLWGPIALVLAIVIIFLVAVFLLTWLDSWRKH